MGSPRSSSPKTRVLVVAHEGRHPIHMLVSSVEMPILAKTTVEGKGYSRGRFPVSRFLVMSIRCKLLRFETHNGNSPDSRFP